MRKINAKEYAQGLVQKNGLPKAKSIADSAVRATNESNWHNAPETSQFYTKNKRGQGVTRNDSFLKGLNGFWAQVAGLLAKVK